VIERANATTWQVRLGADFEVRAHEYVHGDGRGCTYSERNVRGRVFEMPVAEIGKRRDALHTATLAFQAEVDALMATTIPVLEREVAEGMARLAREAAAKTADPSPDQANNRAGNPRFLSNCVEESRQRAKSDAVSASRMSRATRAVSSSAVTRDREPG
jgi:hypothetical protein